MSEDGSTFIHKEPCPECGSRDNLGRYSDGHAHCYGCGHYERGDGSSAPLKERPKMAKELHRGGEVLPLRKRKITVETAQKFGYRQGEMSDKAVQIAPYHDKSGNLVAQKVRFPDKDFTVLGNLKEAGLFGQHLWGSGGKRVVITEGEIDAMAVSQMQGNRWPVVSVPNGAQGAKNALAAELKWLCSFGEVVLMFDMDEPGRKASAECAALFPPGKCKVAALPLKDASDLLMADRGDEIVTAIYQAQPFRPDGILSLKDVKEQAMQPIQNGLPYFSDVLTKATHGRRWGDVIYLGAGTGIGKTDFITQQTNFDLIELGEKVGLFFLEQSPVETAQRLAGKRAARRFHIPASGWTPQELSDALDTLDTGGLYLYDNFGAIEWEVIASNIRYLNHAEGVRIFYLDHLTALASHAEDERKALEVITAEIAMLAKELGIIIHVVSHLATPEGKPHEEGGRVMIRHFKGSRAIGYWAYTILGMERDQQNPDPGLRTITTLRILKHRVDGSKTGTTLFFGYDEASGLLFDTDNPEGRAHGFTEETTATVPDDTPF